MNAYGTADCIILGRGGGSSEDLWAFNEENVVRAIYASTIPIISAVGHEIDYTLSDFVADYRAPTPSAAAELVVPDTQQSQRYYDELVKRFSLTIRDTIEQTYTAYDMLCTDSAFKKIVTLLTESRQQQDQWCDRLYRSTSSIMETMKATLARQASALHALSPLAVLSRGYSVVTTHDGSIVKNADCLHPNDTISIQFQHGHADAMVIKAYRVI
jgi:exodeoxyribonuclease VII large subunit